MLALRHSLVGDFVDRSAGTQRRDWRFPARERAPLDAILAPFGAFWRAGF